LLTILLHIVVRSFVVGAFVVAFVVGALLFVAAHFSDAGSEAAPATAPQQPLQLSQLSSVRLPSQQRTHTPAVASASLGSPRVESPVVAPLPPSVVNRILDVESLFDRDLQLFFLCNPSISKLLRNPATALGFLDVMRSEKFGLRSLSDLALFSRNSPHSPKLLEAIDAEPDLKKAIGGHISRIQWENACNDAHALCASSEAYVQFVKQAERDVAPSRRRRRSSSPAPAAAASTKLSKKHLPPAIPLDSEEAAQYLALLARALEVTTDETFVERYDVLSISSCVYVLAVLIGPVFWRCRFTSGACLLFMSYLTFRSFLQSFSEGFVRRRYA
jgi:hypothetical protein